MSDGAASTRAVVLTYRGAPGAAPARLTARAAAIHALGTPCRVVAESELGKVRVAVVVLHGDVATATLVRARLAGNRVVLEVRDTAAGPRIPGGARLVDGAIFRNRKQEKDLGDARWTSRVIYDEPEPGLRQQALPAGDFRAACFGAGAGGLHFGDLRGVASIDGPIGRHQDEFNCHVALRVPGPAALYAPGVEVANAAACGAVLVTMRDAAAVELLGDDYPFYCESDRPSVEASVRRARKSLGKAEWSAALARLKEVAARTELGVVARQHCEHFAAIEAAIAAAKRAPSPGGTTRAS